MLPQTRANWLPTLRPPEMQGRGVAMADRFLAGGGDIDRFEREGDFDEFFLGVGQGYDIQFWILLANLLIECE